LNVRNFTFTRRLMLASGTEVPVYRRGMPNETPPGTLRSGELAARAGVHRQTLRYYERRGLLEPSERTLGGHRMYSDQAVTVLRVIKAAQRLGFTLDEVAELLTPARAGRGRLADRAAGKLAQVEAKIAELNAVAETLRAVLAAGCDDIVSCADDPEPDCPLPFVPPRSVPPRSVAPSFVAPPFVPPPFVPPPG
jgi:DNA-binding transcriptional MerR regulator